MRGDSHGGTDDGVGQRTDEADGVARRPDDAITFDDLGTDPTDARVQLHRRRSGAVPATLVVTLLLVGIVGSGVAAYSWRSAVRTEELRSFQTSATGAADTLTMALQRDADAMDAARTVVATDPTIDSTQFNRWFTSLDTVRRYPGSFVFAYIQSVTPAELPSFIATTNADPPAGVSPVGGFRLSPPGLRAQYCLIRLASVQIPTGSKVTPNALIALKDQFLSFVNPGTDECAGPQRSRLQAAASSGTLTVGSFGGILRPIVTKDPATRTLFEQVFGNLSPIEMLEPVFATSSAGPSTNGASKVLLGWVGAIFDSTNLLGPVAGRQAGTSYTLSYRGSGNRLVTVSRVGAAATGSITRTFDLTAEGSWVLTVRGPLVGGLSPDLQGLTVLVVGLALTALLFLLFRALSTSRSVAIDMVEETTAELRHLALHDALTGLPNRTLIIQRTTDALERSRASGDPVAVLFIDLDGFKDINDANGHGVGDFLLRAVAERFSTAVDGKGTVGRLGGDEFIVLAEGSAAARPEQLAEQLRAACAEPITISNLPGVALPVAASIGIASGVRASPGELLRDADIALYRAKAAGKACAVVFEPTMHAEVRRRTELDAELRQAMTAGEFFLVYQPIVDLTTSEITGVEALVRWRHPTRGVIEPVEFIPALEESGQIVEVGRHVLETACRQGRLWRDAGIEVRMSVNVSARQLETDRFVPDVHQALAASGLDPASLVLEITETGLMGDADGVAQRLSELKTLGIKVAIDDFGTGFSSLAYLQRFPADVLKIDGSFVGAITTSAKGAALVHAMVQLGKALGLQTLAEGIDDPEHLRLLRIEGCASGQGYLFARPMAPSDIEPLLAVRYLGESEPSGTVAAEP
jgi:diguanylate cyclase (GGDEF)-like protein